jgi:hypothetical protein
MLEFLPFWAGHSPPIGRAIRKLRGEAAAKSVRTSPPDTEFFTYCPGFYTTQASN